jgi:membrane-associated phospholipid phosphatase
VTNAAARRRLAGAAAFAAVAAAVWAVALRTSAGSRLDQSLLEGFLGLGGPRGHGLADRFARLADPAPMALFAAALAVLALVRRRPLMAFTTLAVLAGAGVTTQVLKRVTAEPRAIESLPAAHVAPESWPSGHATAAMAVALCLIAVAPPRWRPHAAAVGGAFALGVGGSVLVLGWHLPSDVLGGYCVAAAWVLIGAAGGSLTGSFARVPRSQAVNQPSLRAPGGRRAGDPGGGAGPPRGESPHRAA